MPEELDQRGVSRRNVLRTVVSGTVATSALVTVPARGHAGELVVPAPTPDSPRLVAMQLSDASPRAVNNLLFEVVNVQKGYGLDNVKVTVFPYADGVRALYKDSAPVPDRIRSLPACGSRFSACCTCRARPFMPRRMSVWPVAIQTRTPEGMGIIAAACSSSPPLPDWDRRPRKYANECRAQTPARSAACPSAPWAVSLVRPAQTARSQQA